MADLLPDEEVARQLNISKKRLQNLRGLDRGDGLGRIPSWVDAPGTAWRPRVRGTRQSAIDAWMDRHETKGAA